MKKLKLAVLLCLGYTLSKSQNSVPTNKNSSRISTSYVYAEREPGYMVSNEVQFHVFKRFYITPQIFYAKQSYSLDNKSANTFTTGAALRLDYAITQTAKWKIEIGAGYAIRRREETWVLDFEPGTFVSENDVFFRKRIYGANCPIANLNIERNINTRLGLGLKTEWQAGGRLKSFISQGVYLKLGF
ncbi:MAG: hypothetical protein IPO27_18960 [Bacteroidetes bacterium]|nr:hypothetical protein [Bacteroidota bacterium]